MDIDEIRRQNILILEGEAGSPTAMAEAVGMSYAQYINLRDGAKDARSGKRRGMRKETAWRFEGAGKKPRGWLDVDHVGSGLGPLNPLEVQLVTMYRALPDGFRDALLQDANKYRTLADPTPSIANPFAGKQINNEVHQ